MITLFVKAAGRIRWWVQYNSQGYRQLSIYQALSSGSLITTLSSTRRWCSFLTVQNKKNKGLIAKFGNRFFCLLLKCLNVFWLPGWGKTSSCTVLLTSLSCKSIYNPKFYFNLRDNYLFADHIFCIQVSNCLIADTEVPENAHMAYRVKFLLNEMIMSKIFWM